MATGRLFIAIACAASITLTASAFAQDVEESADPMALQVHGFVSPGFILTTGNDYLAKTKRGSFEFTEVGINFTKPLTDKLRLGVQLFARDLGAVGNYSAKLDWFYIDYRVADWFGFRVGRVKIPFGLYNEINDVDAARAPVLLPQSVYPIESRDYLLAQTGMEIYGRIDLRGAGALDYRGYVGTIFLEGEAPASAPYELSGLDVPYVVGGRLFWEAPIDGLRIGGSFEALHYDALLTFDASAYAPLQMAGKLAPTFDGKVKFEVPAVLWVSSIEYAAHDWLLAAEYGRWYADIESTQPLLLPGVKNSVSERMYGLVSYHVTPWLQPSLYYSLLFPDTDDHDGRDSYQHDTALTFRFDVNNHWLIKLEGHMLWGTAALRPELNGVANLHAERTWSMFLVKTTGYF